MPFFYAWCVVKHILSQTSVLSLFSVDYQFHPHFSATNKKKLKLGLRYFVGAAMTSSQWLSHNKLNRALINSNAVYSHHNGLAPYALYGHWLCLDYWCLQFWAIFKNWTFIMWRIVTVFFFLLTGRFLQLATQRHYQRSTIILWQDRRKHR